MNIHKYSKKGSDNMASKSVSAMKNIQDICSSLRSKYYGDSATAKDYKDSFVINNAIQIFPIDAMQALIDETISEKDKAEVKVSKSINFRSDCYTKLTGISKMLLCLQVLERRFAKHVRRVTMLMLYTIQSISILEIMIYKRYFWRKLCIKIL